MVLGCLSTSWSLEDVFCWKAVCDPLCCECWTGCAEHNVNCFHVHLYVWSSPELLLNIVQWPQYWELCKCCPSEMYYDTALLLHLQWAMLISWIWDSLPSLKIAPGSHHLPSFLKGTVLTGKETRDFCLSPSLPLLYVNWCIYLYSGALTFCWLHQMLPVTGTCLPSGVETLIWVAWELQFTPSTRGGIYYKTPHKQASPIFVKIGKSCKRRMFSSWCLHKKSTAAVRFQLLFFKTNINNDLEKLPYTDSEVHYHPLIMAVLPNRAWCSMMDRRGVMNGICLGTLLERIHFRKINGFRLCWHLSGLNVLGWSIHLPHINNSIVCSSQKNIRVN